jgi:8-amino-7-oxononanoate synthase
VAATAAAVRQLSRGGLRAVAVADGLCTGCGRPYPLAPVDAVLRAHGGLLLLDDTQALGILGAGPCAAAPYGRGGGGSVRHAGIVHDAVVSVSSLAKAFGAPLATIAGPAAVVAELRTAGSALHSSPPSTVDVAAAAAALARNAVAGERLRARLAGHVRALRARAGEHGVVLVGGLFPVQSTPPVPADAGRRLLAGLAADGVYAVLRRACGANGSLVTLVITVAHRRSEIERAAALLGAAWQTLGGPVRRAR